MALRIDIKTSDIYIRKDFIKADGIIKSKYKALASIYSIIVS